MSVFLLILPDFFLIALGWLLYRRLGFGSDFFQGAEKLVYYVLFPALLFHAITRTELDPASTLLLLKAVLLLTAGGVFLAWLAKPVLKPDPVDHASVAQCAYRFNTYIGLSLVDSLAGPAGTTVMALLVGLAVPLVNMAAVHGLARQKGSNLWLALVRNPLILATVLGLAWNLAQLPVPETAATVLSRLGSGALTVGLLCVGASLSLQGLGGSVPLISWMTGVRLLATPALGLAVAWLLQLPALEAQVLLLFCALPTASTTYVLAVRMGGNGRLVAVTMTLGTLLSAITIPFWIAVGQQL